MIKISSDTTSDLGRYFAQFDIYTMPLAVVLGDSMYYDGESVTPNDIYAYVAKTKQLPKTSARSVEEFKDFFMRIKSPDDQLIHFSLSSELSVSYVNAKKAAEEVGGVYVIDTKLLSTGSGILALYACVLRDCGKYSAQEIVNLVNKRKPFVQTSFVVDTMDYLHKGGRCSGLVKIIASVFNIHPELILKDGKIVVGSKYTGSFKKIIARYVGNILTMYGNPDKRLAIITHTSASPEIVNIVKDILTAQGFENILETIAGSTITSHCGKGTIGFVFINDGGLDY